MRDIDYKLISYMVINRNDHVTTEFNIGEEYWLDVRLKAIELAVKMRDESNLPEKYSGIILEMTFGIPEDIDTWHICPILTGDRMNSEEILTALNAEYEALDFMGLHFDEMKTVMESQSFYAVNQKHATLYNFTVT